MFFRKNLFIIAFLITLFTNLFAQKVYSDKENSNTFTITSENQSQNNDGKFEAIGNVKIEGNDGFNAKSDRLLYERNNSQMNLIGNVEIENYKFENMLIRNVYGDEFILLIEEGGFQINSSKGKQVKTKLTF